MNRMYIWCVLLLLVGCQQPTVYVYTENLDAQQQAQLDLALSAQRLPYKYTQLSVPREFGDATLMLSEDKILTEQTEILAGIMQRLGYQPEIKYTTAANHFYNHGNIGFYLKAPSEEDEISLPNRVFTTHCDEDKFNGLMVTFTEKHVEFVLPGGTPVSLKWDYLYGYLVIYYKNYSQTYSHSTPYVSTPFGEKPTDTYRYTIRVNQPSWLNCSLQIVYMD